MDLDPDFVFRQLRHIQIVRKGSYIFYYKMRVGGLTKNWPYVPVGLKKIHNEEESPPSTPSLDPPIDDSPGLMIEYSVKYILK
jgi:hypothetical protein